MEAAAWVYLLKTGVPDAVDRRDVTGPGVPTSCSCFKI